MKNAAKSFSDITKAEAVTLDLSDIRIPVKSFEAETEEEYHLAMNDYLDSLAFLAWGGTKKVEVENLSPVGPVEIAVRVCDDVAATLEADTVIVKPVGGVNYAVKMGDADEWCAWIDSEMSQGRALAGLGAGPFAAYLAGLGIGKETAKEVFTRFFPA
jgi:hypothetical protein